LTIDAMDPTFDFRIHWALASSIITVLLIISAFFSVAETALTGSSRPRLAALASRGVPRAIQVLALRDRQGEALSAILLGNNLVNMIASAFATGWLIDLFGEVGVAYAAGVMTVLVVVFGEVLPKTIALAHADRVILSIAPAVAASLRILMPLSRLTQGIAHLVLALFQRSFGRSAQDERAEELRGAIEMHVAPDPDVKQERAMLRSILDLADVTVAQVMIDRSRIESIDIGQPPAQVLEQALSSAYTRIPAFRGSRDNMVGVLHTKSLLAALRAAAGRPDAIDLTQVMNRPWFIPESTTLLDQLQAFRRRREHFALVVDEYGVVLGAVTLEDILEEIVGDIADRHEFQVPGVRAQPDGSWIVDGTVTIRDLKRDLDWDLPDEPAATVAGLVIHEARTIPDAGQVFEFHGFRFEIVRRHRNRVVLLRVARVAPRPAAAPSATTSAPTSSM
jgi:Mg2+/Co2+ transporter CorB